MSVATFCALCVSRCGARATVEGGKLVSLEPDPSHPTGRALCLKGKAAPEIIEHPERLLHPLARTRPKGDPDPGWKRISWDQALETTAARLSELSREHGPESVAFSSASPSASAMSDSLDWVQRLRRAFGSPNLCMSMELCGWGRYLASSYTFGAPVPGLYMPDLENAGCILLWGYNPSVARLVHATAISGALERGARLICVDPRRAGLAHRADPWLRVRPGGDGALALAIAHVMIERGWYDADFVRQWSNGPLLVRADSGRLVRASDLSPAGDSGSYVAWDAAAARPALYDPRRGACEVEPSRLALSGEVELSSGAGPLACRPAFAAVAETCRRHRADAVEAKTGVAAADVERAARILWESRPVAFYSWSGVEQHANATQTVRAINLLYALTGSLDRRGGNVLFGAAPRNPIAGADLLPEAQRQKALGLEEHPLGPARWEFVTSDALYTAALDARPYRVRGLVGFGANLLLAHADSERGRRALASLDFYAHADLFMNPTAEMADIVLPVATPFETEGLRMGFEVSAEAQSLVQLRAPLVERRGESRPDIEIVFELAARLGLGEAFFGGDIDAAYRHQLEPSGVSLERLRAEPAGVRVAVETRYRKFAGGPGGVPRGFDTPTRRVELYSETFLDSGYPPLPDFAPPPAPSPTDEAARRYPLRLTCAKHTRYCDSQHRGVAALRRGAPDPEVELHPEAARARGIESGDWVRIETPAGSVRARARLNRDLDPAVVCGQHGWWQGCDALGAPAYDPFSARGANYNRLIRHRRGDPISGTAPHRGGVCEIVRG